MIRGHQHGVIDSRCKHPECKAAFARYKKRYTLDRLRGIERRCSSEPARQHIAALQGLGWSRRAIAGAAGVSHTVIAQLAAGAQQFLRVDTATRILAVTADQVPSRASRGVTEPFVPRVGTVRRLQALQAMGWTTDYLRDNYRIPTSTLYQQGIWVTRTMHETVAKAYRDLSHKPGPSAITRRRALAKGYLSPAAWHDIDLDAAPDTEQEPESTADLFDEAVVLRRLNGDRSVAMRKADRLEIVARARAKGWSLHEIERITGIEKADRYLADRLGAAS